MSASPPKSGHSAKARVQPESRSLVRLLHARRRAEGARRRRDDASFYRAEVSVRTVKAEHAKRTKVSHFLRWLEAVGQFQRLTS